MFYSKTNGDFIQNAWSDFKDRLRWKLFFLDQQLAGNSVEKDFDPDYEIPHDRSAACRTEPYIELGLSVGDSFVQKFCEAEIPRIKRASRPSRVVQIDRIEQYLKEHDLVIVPTDKNLGTAVVKRQWIIDGCTKLLDDANNYEQLSAAERQMTLQQLVDDVATQ
jgi:ribosomal protein L18E